MGIFNFWWDLQIYVIYRRNEREIFQIRRIFAYKWWENDILSIVYIEEYLCVYYRARIIYITRWGILVKKGEERQAGTDRIEIYYLELSI